LKWLVWALVVFSSAVGLALVLRFNEGNVAILWPPYRIDVSVNLALALGILGFVGLHLAINALTRALDLPRKVREYRQRRQEQTSNQALREALLAFFEGRLARSERLARSALASTALRAPAALVAARAAHRMQESARRDDWLRIASEDPAASSAVLMLQAEMAVEDRRTLEAIELLDTLRSRGALHIVALRTDLRAREQAGHWADMLRILRLIEHRDALHPSAVRKLRLTALRGLLTRCADDLAEIRLLARNLRPQERLEPELACLMASAFMQAGATDEARRLLEPVIDQDPSQECLAVWIRTCEGRERESMERLQNWRQRHGDRPALALATGRVCMLARLWGKAEESLLDACRRAPSTETHLALASLHAGRERVDDAAAQFKLAALAVRSQP
jgi:HemY protein